MKLATPIQVKLLEEFAELVNCWHGAASLERIRIESRMGAIRRALSRETHTGRTRVFLQQPAETVHRTWRTEVSSKNRSP
jgi:hypothetical protein